MEEKYEDSWEENKLRYRLGRMLDSVTRAAAHGALREVCDADRDCDVLGFPGTAGRAGQGWA